MKKYFKLILLCLGSAITVFAYYKAASAENKDCPRKSYASKEDIPQNPSETSNQATSDSKNNKDISNTPKSRSSSANSTSGNDDLSFHDTKPHRETSINKNNNSDKNVTKDKPIPKDKPSNNQEQKPKNAVTSQNKSASSRNTYENYTPSSNNNQKNAAEKPVDSSLENNSNDQEKNHETEGFNFIKSNEKVRNFIGDGHILLYVGIILLVVSILGIIITFVPKKFKKKKPRRK